MKNTTLYLPGFHLATLRRTPRSARQIFAEKMADLKQKTFSQLGECFGQFIPVQHLRPAKSGPSSRRRFFSKENTFWAFFSQMLDADGGCQEVVRKLQAFAAMQSNPYPPHQRQRTARHGKSLNTPALRRYFSIRRNDFRRCRRMVY